MYGFIYGNAFIWIELVLNIIKAKHLATQEERKIRSLVAVLVDFQLKKMDLKMKQLDELETMLEKERETIENQRRQVRINFVVHKHDRFFENLVTDWLFQLIAERQQFHMEQIKSLEAARARTAEMGQMRPDGEVCLWKNCPNKTILLLLAHANRSTRTATSRRRWAT